VKTIRRLLAIAQCLLPAAPLLAEAREAIVRLIGTTNDWSRLDDYLISYLVEPSMRTTVLASSLAATLEMVREGIMELHQNAAFAPIYVRKRGEVSIEEEPAAMEVAADSPDPLARREMTEELKRLLECVGGLQPDRQKLVLLAYYNGWSREQLATKFETPVNTVKTWLRRSLMDIRECLGL